MTGSMSTPLLKGEDLYSELEEYVLTDRQLRANNFPCAAPGSNSRAVLNAEERYSRLKDNERFCHRCSDKFEMGTDGKPISGMCYYHAGKFGGGMCLSCGRGQHSRGCLSFRDHVHRKNLIYDVDGYVKTMPAPKTDARNHKTYCIDCEMIYTTNGLELARVTVIDENSKVVYDTLVKPDSATVDYNTRFSGVTSKDLQDVSTSLGDVQSVLLDLISDETILLGHSLNSDLTALKMFHKTVVDTSVVFPHETRPQYKLGLKVLAKQHLHRNIQMGRNGHDSFEDAKACFDLIQFKLKRSRFC